MLNDVLAFRQKMKMLTAGKILLFVLAFIAILAFMAPVVFAQARDGIATGSFLQGHGEGAACSYIDGLLTSLLGYLKQTPPESFELDKFLATAMISVIMGVLTLGFGWDYTTAQE